MRALIRFLTALNLLAALLGACSLDAATAYELSPTYGHVRFSIIKWGVFQEEGTFHDVSGKLVFDAEKPEASHVDVVVRAASIDTNNSGRDRVLRSDDFFDVEKYPTLEFHSSSVVPHGRDQFDVTGALTIHSVTNTITVPVRLLGSATRPNVGQLVGFETAFSIDRTDYAVLGSKWSAGQLLLSKQVQISIRLGGVHRE